MLLPVPRSVREWAYAGLTFDVVAAIVSCLASGKSANELWIPFFALVLLGASYVMWRRRTGAMATLTTPETTDAVLAAHYAAEALQDMPGIVAALRLYDIHPQPRADERQPRKRRPRRTSSASRWRAELREAA